MDSNSINSLRTNAGGSGDNNVPSSTSISIGQHTQSIIRQSSRFRHHSSGSSRKFSTVVHVNGASGSSSGNWSGSGHFECPLCLLELPVEFFPNMSTCNHRACYDCLQQYLKIEISESRVMITCPECTELIHPNDIRMILNDEEFTCKYEKFMLRRVLVAEPDARWCPAPDCGYVVIASGCAGCPKLQCHRPGCHTNFCYHCKQEWHPNQTCDAARAQRSNGRRESGDASLNGHHNNKDTDIKPCPTCKVLIIKMDDGSCNHMTCSVCGTEFCWLCMKQISDLHYLSPSGCTFWGKKPWSRKKKIMWQLGMLVGAPVGIALIAGIAVPAIIIGIPVWVGRKLHARFQKRENMTKKNRNMMVATGVVASVCVSPILALVAVGIGIPILLAYVYGVVPISLCRSGGCGVDNTSSGVRIEMSSEDSTSDDATFTKTAADELSVDTAVSNKVNPSIGEVSLGMSASLSMGSGSHMDRVGYCGDRESASNAPLAGSIASASNRLEVQADVSSNKRFSFSSETASCGLSLTSEKMSTFDDGGSSIRALAGSIMSRSGPGSISGHPDTTSLKSNKTIEERTSTPVSIHVEVGNIEDDSRREASISSSRSGSRGQAPHPVMIQAHDTVITMNPSGGSPSPAVRCVSFQPVVVSTSSSSSTGVSPMKSRSLEQLVQFCEVCHSSHRPCCPNFRGKSDVEGGAALISVKGFSKKSSSKRTSQETTSCSSKNRRKSSLKSGTLDSTSTTTSLPSKSNLKRVKSSESSSGSARRRDRHHHHQASLRSTPASLSESSNSFQV